MKLTLSHYARILLPALLVNCHDAPSDVPSTHQAKNTDAQLQVHTQITAQSGRVQSDNTVQVAAGETLRVRCLVRRGAQVVDDLPWRVTSEPPLTITRSSSSEVHLTAAAPGIYQVRCVAAEAVVDPVGVRVQVHNGGPSLPEESSQDETASGLPFTPSPPAGALDPLDSRAGLPYAWEAEWPAPSDGKCYWQNRKQFLLHKKVRDVTGAVLPDARIVLHSDPPADIDPELHSVSFPEAGIYTVRAEVEGPHAPGATLRPVVQTFVVDSTPPRIEIISPVRGAMLQEGSFGTSPVEVRGFIEDDSGLLEASVNGQLLTLEPDTKRLAFAVSVPSSWGVNMLQVSATDRCAMQGRHAQAFVRSPVYAESTSVPTHAVRARLAQPALDDRTRHAPTNVASLVEHALQADSLKHIFPEHLSAYPDADGDGKLDEVTYRCWSGPSVQKKNGFEVVRHGEFSYGQAHVVALDAHPGYWSAQVVFRKLYLPVRVDGYRDLWCIGSPRVTFVEAAVEAEEVTVSFNIQANSHEARLDVPKDSLQVVFKAGEPRLTFSRYQGVAAAPVGLLDQVRNGAFSRAYNHLFAERLRGRLHKELQRALETFVASMRLDDTLHLPSVLGGPVRFVTAVDHLTVDGDPPHGYGELGLQAAISTPQAAPSGWGGGGGELRGPIRAAPTTPDLRLEPGQTASMVIYDDFINQGLHALWLQNAFSIPDLDTRLRIGRAAVPAGIKAKFFATMPPVLMPGEIPNEVVIGWGDAYISAQIDLADIAEGRAADEPVYVTAYCSTKIAATLAVDPKTQRLTLLPTAAPELRIQVVDLADAGHQALASDQLEHWMRRAAVALQGQLGAAMPNLARVVLGEVPLPIFDFDGTSTVWRLERPDIERPAGAAHSVLRGRLTASTVQKSAN